MALLKIVWPLIYGNLFAVTSRLSTPIYGSPYFLMVRTSCFQGTPEYTLQPMFIPAHAVYVWACFASAESVCCDRRRE